MTETGGLYNGDEEPEVKCGKKRVGEGVAEEEEALEEGFCKWFEERSLTRREIGICGRDSRYTTSVCDNISAFYAFIIEV